MEEVKRAGIVQGTKQTISSIQRPFSLSSAVTANPTVGVVLDGRTLNTIFQGQLEHKFLELTKYSRSVLCCRCTPLQKSMVVKLVRNQLKVMTLAVGEYLIRTLSLDKHVNVWSFLQHQGNYRGK